jgi:uncharacterized protein YecE (DUF72 family)
MRFPASLYHSGTSGIALPAGNKSDYPDAFKQKSRLTYYSSLFNSIEINSTFKKLPMHKTIARWVTETSEAFQFTFKLSKSITHNKNLQFAEDDVHRFLEAIHYAGSKKGCILIQFPGKTKRDSAPQLEHLIALMQTSPLIAGWKIAVEFRHSSWYHKDIYDLLGKYHSAVVFHDLFNAPPSPEIVTGGFAYLRFHGTEQGYRGGYSEEQLAICAQRIRSWNAAGVPVYVYFNNTLGEAAGNLVTLNRMLEAD